MIITPAVEISFGETSSLTPCIGARTWRRKVRGCGNESQQRKASGPKSTDLKTPCQVYGAAMLPKHRPGRLPRGNHSLFRSWRLLLRCSENPCRYNPLVKTLASQ